MLTEKAAWRTNNDNFTLTMPIAKVDKDKRIVSGFGTLDNVDEQGDRVTKEASIKAFEEWAGNVRLMHDKVPAGKAVEIMEKSYEDENGDSYEGVFVDVYISKGAPNVWEMVLDGTLQGFSIGGTITEYDMEKSADGDSVRIIKGYELQELSLVDVPANSFARIMSVQKSNGVVTIDSIYNDEVSKSSDTIEESEMLKLVKNIWSIVSKSDKGGVKPLADEEVEKAIVQPDTASVKQRDERVEEPVEAPPVDAAPEEPVEKIEKPEKVKDEEPKKVEKSYDDLVAEIEGLAGHIKTVTEVMQKLATRVADLEKTDNIREVSKSLDEIVGRLAAVEADTATKQSGDIAKSTVVKPRKESFWGGAILKTSDL